MRHPYFFIWCFVFLTGSLLGQEDLTVITLDYLENQPAGGVEVLLLNPSRGLQRRARTDGQGRAVFRALPVVDGYRVRVPETAEYHAINASGIDLRSNEDPTVQIVLLRKQTVDLGEVVVSANTTAKINRRDAEVASELQREELEAIPVEGRDLTRALFRLPNVSRATGFYPEAPNVSINGANPLFTSYLIDGLDNNERFLGGQKFAIPTGFARNITVLTNNYSAEYGLTANGVVNVTTRSGSNDFTGEAFVITRPGPVIDGASPYAQRDLSGNLVKDGFQRYQAGVALGGPIVRNQTFFYLDAEHTTDLKDNFLNSELIGAGEQATIRGENRFTYLSGKVDHQWSARFRSSLRANLGLVQIDRQGGGLEGGTQFPSAANVQDRNSLLVAWKNSYVGDRFSAETNLQYARFHWNYGRPEGGSSPQATVLNPAEETIAILGHPGFVFDERESTWQLQQKFKYYADDHTFKAGVGIISSDHQLFGGGNPDGNYTVKLTEDQIRELRGLGRGVDLDVQDIPAEAEVINYSVELRPRAFGARQTIYSFYLEDQWSASDRLTLTLGLRYDYDDLSRGGGGSGDVNNVAPRFNANYRLGQRSSLRAGYGVFYDKIPYAIYSDALQQNTTGAQYRRQLEELLALGVLPAETDLDAITFDGNLAAFATDVDYLQAPAAGALQGQRDSLFSNERRILNPKGYDNPYTHQIALGYQLQLDQTRLFYVDLVHNRSHKLFRLRNLNAASVYRISREEVDRAADPTELVRSPAAADRTRPVPIENGAYAVLDGENLTGVARNVVMSETAGRSNYYALSLNLQKERGQENYAYRLNYTLSYLENNTEDINFRAMDGNAFEYEWGPSINDRRHIINGLFSFFPIPNLGLTLAGLLQSGQPINRIPDALLFGTTDLNGDGAAFGDAYVGNSDRFPGEARNNDRLPWSTQFDLGLQYAIPIGTGELALRADVFNMFNAQNLSGYSNAATQSNQIQAGPRDSGILVRRNAGAPRQFQFSLRYLW